MLTVMRYVVIGAGAVGGSVGGRLAESGHEVVLVARGAHLAALRTVGLRLVTPEADRMLHVATAAGPDELELRGDDVLLLATKTQDSTVLLEAWGKAPVGARTAGKILPVVCVQNGVTNERLAAERFDRVYGACVWLPSTHLQPGVVVAPCAPLTGILHLGRHPDGNDDTVRAVAADLEASRIRAPVHPDVMRWKHGKLLNNLGNAFDALFEQEDSWLPLLHQAVEEGRAAYEAAGIATTTPEEERDARGDLMRPREIAGHPRSGGSTWQSLARGLPLETEHLNGEIVRLGRLHGVPTPVNTAVTALARVAVAVGTPPRTLTVDALHLTD